jgi:hypothetical protein
MDNHIVSIFDFIKKFMASDGVTLVFHLDDLCVLKEIKSYMERKPSNEGKCEGMDLHTPKGASTWGVGVPVDSQIFKE